MAIILVVEDELAQLIAEAMRLMDRGRHIVFTAGRADEAVRKARTIQSDLILMDLRLPGYKDTLMGGIKAIRKIRAFAPSVPILALTAYGDEHTRQQAMEAGATEYVTKPLGMPELQKIVERLLNKPAAGER